MTEMPVEERSSAREPRRTRFGTVKAALVGVVLVLSACAPTASPAPASNGVPTSSTATPPGQSAAAAVTRPIVIVDGSASFGGIDPAENYDNGGAFILANVYDRLIRMNGNPPTPQPMLATEVPTVANGGISADGLVYTFKLHPGAKFHDGTPVDANAVLSSFERTAKLKLGPNSVSADWVAKSEAVDPLTVKFTLTKPFSDFLAALASGWGSYIVSPAAVKAHEANGDAAHAWLEDNDAGSGPYTIRSFDHAAKTITLDRVKDYWGSWTEGPHIESAILRWGVESPTERLMLEKGDADIATGLTSTDFGSMGQQSGVVAQTFPSLYQVNINFNNSVAPFNDLKVRQAMQYTLDRDTVNNSIFAGNLGGMIGVLGAAYPEAYPPTTKFDFNLTTAQQLLTEAGYGPEHPLEFAVSPLHYWAADTEVLQLWQSDLAKIGVKMQIQQIDVGTFNTAYFACNAATTPGIPPAFTGGVSADYISGWEPLWLTYSSELRPCNTNYSKNPQADDLLNRISSESSTAARKPLMEQLNQILTDDAQDLWVGTVPNSIAMRDVVKGYRYTDLLFLQYIPLAEMYLDR